MADFTGHQIRNTYQRLLQLDDFITQNGTGSINLESVHVSGSVYVTGSQVISENLHVLGNVTAEQFISTTVSSSVIYESGSSQFGNSLDDTHNFTGSLNLTGSIITLGTRVHTGSTFELGSRIQIGNTQVTGSTDLSGSLNVEAKTTLLEGAYVPFVVNKTTVERDQTVQTGHKGRMFGPITIANGKVFTIEGNSKIEIIDI